MSKQYMDFAPRKAARTASASKRAAEAHSGVTRAKKPVTARQTTKTATARPVARKSTVQGTGVKKPTVRSTGAGTFSSEKKPKLGAIEDLSPKFVKTDVPKRPLGAGGTHFRTKKTGVAAVKAQKVGLQGARTNMKPKAAAKPVAKTGAKLVEKPVENSDAAGATAMAAAAEKYQVPKSPFINQGKVQKRPLSKNVYAKKIEIPKEVLEAKGPVTIISKPEKQAHTGMIVTIILTIILGAAAGTVAFLLLPK